MPSHEVVISGLAGTFPECLNAKVLEDEMFGLKNLVDSERKWEKVMKVPHQIGKLKKSFQFDQTFFGIHRRLCNVMDIHARHSIEKSFEAICDAGLNPTNLKGSNIAVIMSSMTSDTEYGSVMVSKTSGHAMLGNSRCMQANRISYFFNFKGPSFALDSSWVGPMQGLAIAHNLVSKGFVKAAIVGASNMIVYPQVSVHYEGLRKLNNDGKTKSYSADADGYSRAEGIVVFFLQRETDALRSYGSIVKVMCSTKMDHRAVFSDQFGFNSFLKDFYTSIPFPLKFSDIGYIEGDGNASLTIEAMELNGIDEVISPARGKQLLVGSCKSRLGHAESAAAFISIVNAIIAMKTGNIPPTLHFTSNNPLVPALQDGRLKIVSEKTPLEGDYIGVSTIGLSSIYAHALLKRNPKSRGVREITYFPPDDIPRIFLLSGREENDMIDILKKVESEPVDEYSYSLNHGLFKSEIPKHLYRGFAVVGENKSHSEVESYQSGSTKQPIWFVFSGMGSQWLEMGTGIMKIPVIRKAIEKCHQTLLPKGIDLISLITSTDETVYDNILHAFVGIAAIQIALVDLLEEIGITPDGIVGHSVGELGCSYADKCLTAEQVILAAYARGKASNDAPLIKGMMAAVGKSYKDIKDELPEEIEVACHNSKRSCTLSGPVEVMEVYVEGLKKRGIFAKLVNVANIAYHSKNIAPAAPYLLKYLKEIIPEPKLRSSKWVSSSVIEGDWDSDLAKYCSAEYHTNNLLSYVLFEEATAHVPNKAICIEIAPHGLLQAIVKKSLSTCTHVPLTNRTHKDGCSFLIEALGKLYMSGLDMDLSKIYPPVDYPVPRETDYLHHVVTWDHAETWIPITLQILENKQNPYMSWKDVELHSNETDELFASSNHIIFGQTIFAKSHILGSMSDFLKEKFEDKPTMGFDFRNILFHMDQPYTKKMSTKIQLLHQRGTGGFEVLYDEEPLITGQINPLDSSLPDTTVPMDFKSHTGPQTFISENQIYDYFESNNCSFTGVYRNISNITINERGFKANIKWNGNSEYFMDALFKLIIFYTTLQNDTLMDIDLIRQFLFDPSSLPEESQDIEIYYDKKIGRIAGDGVRMSFVRTKPLYETSLGNLDVKNRQFTPYSSVDPNIEFMNLCVQLIRENSHAGKVDLQVLVDESSHICNLLTESLHKQPLQSMMINLRVRSSKDITFIPEMASSKGFNGCYFVISDNTIPEIVNVLMNSDIKFYVIHTGKSQNKEVFTYLTPLFEQRYHRQKVVLYTKKNVTTHDANFVKLTTNYIKELKTLEGKEAKKINFLLFKYTMLSDIVNVLLSTSSYSIKDKRYVFIDEFAPPFDPTTNFYKEQLEKDLKINIAFKGKWGSLKDEAISVSAVSPSYLNYSEHPLNNVRCTNVNLKVIGINLQNIVVPSLYKKFGVIEYAGVLGQEEVFGLGRLTEDNFIEVDPELCWKKPVDWTLEEAATVPLFYTIAYHILYLKSRVSNRPYDTVLIHGGHTPFSQAVINVAISLNIGVYTTCFSYSQKRFIMNKFPQIKEEHIYNVSATNRFEFIDNIMDSTKGSGIKIVIDALEDPRLRNLTLQCTGDMGRYFLICNSAMDSEHTFGMNIFMREMCTVGYNPELLFDLNVEEKLKLGGILLSGIKTQIVRPLATYIIDEPCSRKKATDIVIEKSHTERPRKVLMTVDETESTQVQSTNPKAITGKKNYMIIGTYNNLWFDVLKWLVSRKAESIQVVLNQNEIPEYIRRSYNNFIMKHRYISVSFNGADHLNTAQSSNEFIKKFQNGSTIDAVYYIKPGYEKQITNFDYALRSYSKPSNLITVGFQACLVTERRKLDGLEGTAFILVKTNLRNSMIISVLDNWLTKREKQHGFIILDKEKLEDEIVSTNSDILPTSLDELLELCSEVSEQPCFKEMPSRCPPSRFTREVNPIFVFPGLKLSKINNFTRKMMYPSYVAKYPLEIKTVNSLASQFSKVLIQQFDLSMFTLIAEGWAGTLALTIAKFLEESGKMSEVILLDALPSTVKKLSSHINKSKSIISKYLPTTKENEEISLKDIRNWCNQLSISISNEKRGEYTPDEVHSGLTTMVNRLEVASDFPQEHFTVKSVVHLFTPETNSNESFSDLDQMCETPVTHHIVTGVSTEDFLDSPSLTEDTCNLVLLEYKRAAVTQHVKDIATLDLILDSKFNTEGLSRI